MRTDYYTNKREHVMTHAVFAAMPISKVGQIIGGLAKERRPKGKKARKQA